VSGLRIPRVIRRRIALESTLACRRPSASVPVPDSRYPPHISDQIVVVPYDPEWPTRFEAERELLERVLAPWLKGGVHHVGSTAIPGIAAKPVIDIVAGVASFDEARAAFEPLSQELYVSDPHRPGIAHHFAKPSRRLPEITHSLHLTEEGSDLA
jgi:GrpB-like predicted nucleotidyltransferase (UPF0157 family)